MFYHFPDPESIIKYRFEEEKFQFIPDGSLVETNYLLRSAEPFEVFNRERYESKVQSLEPIPYFPLVGRGRGDQLVIAVEVSISLDDEPHYVLCMPLNFTLWREGRRNEHEVSKTDLQLPEQGTGQPLGWSGIVRPFGPDHTFFTHVAWYTSLNGEWVPSGDYLFPIIEFEEQIQFARSK